MRDAAERLSDTRREWCSLGIIVGLCLGASCFYIFGCQAQRDRETVEGWMPVSIGLRYVDYENRDRGAER